MGMELQERERETGTDTDSLTTAAGKGVCVCVCVCLSVCLCLCVCVYTRAVEFRLHNDIHVTTLALSWPGAGLAQDGYDVGRWWSRKYLGEYFPAVSRDNQSLRKFLRKHGWDSMMESS